MQAFVSKTWRFFETHTVWLLAAGLSASALHHVRRWQTDRQRADRLQIFSKNTPAPLQEQPLVSILLPAWNETGQLPACIESILGLRYPNKELVICAGGDDNSFAIAQQYERQGVIVFEQLQGEGKQAALQRCYEASKGELIYLTDADCQVGDECFERTLAPVINSSEMAATGAWQPYYRQISKLFVQQQWSNHLYREAWLPDYPDALDGRNAAIRRQALDQAGAFQTPAPTGTDYVLSKTLACAGFRIRFAPASRVQTDYPETIPLYLRQASRWYRTPLIQGCRYGDHALVRSVLQAGIFSWIMLILPLLAPFSKTLCTAWLGALGHLVLGQLRVAMTARRCTPRYPSSHWSVLASFVFLPVGWLGMALGLRDAVNTKKSLRW